MKRIKTNNQKKVAIFDIDGTIFRSSLLIEVVEALIDKGIFPDTARKTYIRAQKAWHDRTGSYEDYIDKVVASFLKHIKGVYYKDFINTAEEVVEREKFTVYRYTRDLIAELKKKKYFLLAISQSPKGILDKFCKHLGFDKVYGRFYETGPMDAFTGRVVDEHLIGNKANIVWRAVEKENLTLKDSIGVGDTEGDIPVLELVDRPICFNPNALLYKWAKKSGAEVIVERKDVVYKIQ
ncbi:MAG: HAD-IB family hydrolase [Candidatus Zambryskibacteria bacterium CG10_big_fil_rev_8_21_14_0_10_42_12]|uniref:phosphoserine phosphatase n=1 Tax=Candidatus Zambryskibacteria bacterium CG10_big_fil_rev_8_21_14_0_10_42_12 TaxID=1975115 RepID=A0A2H0QWI5_9BACT|nr:MAG: HAD-IB family hydrolase [Candidatus Zambryskibacteria bacterium CG10_big_fil_rev_8_21_14_0_10_42_12]